MSDSNKHTGFSFQISETPPPAKAVDGTPLADLDLDMGDFGVAPEPSPLPAPVRAAPDISAWVDEPSVGSPAPTVESEATELKKQLDPPNPAPQTQPVIHEQPAPVVVQPEPLAQPDPIVAKKDPVASKEEPQPEPSTSINAPKKDATAVESKPRIKKIQFPARNATSTSQKKSIAQKKLVSRTKFSKSISSQGPRPQLDSEPEIDEPHSSPVSAPHSATAPPATAAPSPVTMNAASKMAPPEDLPGADDEILPPTEADANWGTDTPSAREIWQRARTTWSAASRQAAVLGGQGMRASKALAESMNEKVRERLREAAEERKAQAEAKQAPAQHAANDSSVREGFDNEAPGPAPARHNDAKHSGPGPSRAGQVILGLAKSTGKKIAAPLSAVAAATMVYFAGTHLLGTDGTVALSKAVKGPDIPELGTLEEEGDEGSEESEAPSEEQDSGEFDAPSKAKKKSKGPQPMQTEVTEMPEGLSWPGKGLIEVVTSGEELVYVDGVFTGRGPLRRIPVSPGEHEVSIRTEGTERTGSVEVQANKNTRAVFKEQ